MSDEARTGDARRLLDDPALVRVLDLLDRDDEEARVVGGAVRNALMGRPVADYDITTTALPKVVLARAAKAGLRTVATGLAHGTVTLLVDKRPFEVTTLREDVATDGRHATVRFGRDFATDARRRDFTINALSLGRDGTVHDYADGLADLARRRVRFIGDPTTRIREDYLRILRFFRFSAEYGEGPLDAAGLAAAVRERDGIARLSRERIRQELLKLLAARRAVEVVEAVAEAGLMGRVLGGVPQPRRLARLIAREAEASPILRLAALAALLPEDARRLRERLALSNAETDGIEAAATVLTALHGRPEPPPTPDLLGLMLTHGRAATIDGLRLAAAEARPEAEAQWVQAIRTLDAAPDPRFPFSGAELIARGIAPGKALGDALRRLRAAWVAAGLPEDRDQLDALLAQVLSDAGAPPTPRDGA